MPAVLLNRQDIIEDSHTEEPPKVDNSTHRSAFMVLVTKDGDYLLEPDINKPVIPERKPTGSEIKGSLSTILMDIQAQETAMTTIAFQQQMMQGIMNQQQNAKIIQELSKAR